MEGSVIVFTLLIAVTYGRIAVTDKKLSEISNDILDENALTKHSEQQPEATNCTNPELLVIPINNNLNDLTDPINLATVAPVVKEPCINNNADEHNNFNESNCSRCAHDTVKNENDSVTVTPEVKEPCINNNADELNNLIESDIFRCARDTVKNEALILTPFIEEGKLEEARRASEVDSDLFLGIKSYSGFFTVNKTYNSNIFFWYFPVEKKLVNDTPWIFWLQGGPGASSMIGVFDEIGPFKVNAHMSLVRNPYTWQQNHSLVFIENPVGTGFSFTNHKDGFVTDMSTYTKHLYSTLKQLLLVFPELKTAPLFVTGESYAGKYVPALGLHIHRHKDKGLVNLKGLILGNAYVEPGQLSNITRSFYEFGMVVEEQVAIVQPLADAFRADIAANRSAAAKDKFNTLVALLLFLSNQKQAYNFLADELTAGKYEPFLARPEVKKALHVGNITHAFLNVTVNFKLGPDFLTSTRPMIEELLNDYNVLVYCGQLDQMLPCAVSSEHYRRWRWDHYEEFRNASRSPFILNKKLAGYFKTGGHLTEVLIRGGGHLVAEDQPVTTRELVTRWTHSRPLGAERAPDLTYLRDFVLKNTNKILLPPLL